MIELNKVNIVERVAQNRATRRKIIASPTSIMGADGLQTKMMMMVMTYFQEGELDTKFSLQWPSIQIRVPRGKRESVLWINRQIKNRREPP